MLRSMQQTTGKIAFGVLVILHFIGIIGLNSTRYEGEFKSLIWVNLLFIFGIVLSLHPKWNTKYIVFVVSAFAIGMLVEVIGVRTGQLFGAYHYTGLLGIKIMDVPLVIGMNWVILSYCAGMLSSKINPSITIRVIFGALLMVGLDILIEPFAIRYDMWVWNAGSPPIKNYLAWFVIGLGIMTLFHNTIRGAYNKVASFTLILLAVFFGLDWLLQIF
jgi:uncharacterized membrane protein